MSSHCAIINVFDADNEIVSFLDILLAIKAQTSPVSSNYEFLQLGRPCDKMSDVVVQFRQRK